MTSISTTVVVLLLLMLRQLLLLFLLLLLLLLVLSYYNCSGRWPKYGLVWEFIGQLWQSQQYCGPKVKKLKKSNKVSQNKQLHVRFIIGIVKELRFLDQISPTRYKGKQVIDRLSCGPVVAYEEPGAGARGCVVALVVQPHSDAFITQSLVVCAAR